MKHYFLTYDAAGRSRYYVFPGVTVNKTLHRARACRGRAAPRCASSRRRACAGTIFEFNQCGHGSARPHDQRQSKPEQSRTEVYAFQNPSKFQFINEFRDLLHPSQKVVPDFDIHQFLRLAHSTSRSANWRDLPQHTFWIAHVSYPALVRSCTRARFCPCHREPASIEAPSPAAPGEGRPIGLPSRAWPRVHRCGGTMIMVRVPE
jgi:hypothetical protein